MLLRLFERGNTQQAIVWLLLALPVLLFSFSFHEAAHAFAANKMGDPTAKNLGRLTMNPAKHIDPVGFGAMLLVGIGWAKPVPVHTRYFKDPKKGMAFTAAAGPLSNVLLAFVGVIGYTIMQSVTGQIPFSYIALLEHPEAMEILGVTSLQLVFLAFFSIFTWINATLAVFNMIPIPPFDGSRLAFFFLPDRHYFGMMKYERFIMIGLIVAMATGILTDIIAFFTNLLVDTLSFLPRLIAGM